MDIIIECPLKVKTGTTPQIISAFSSQWSVLPCGGVPNRVSAETFSHCKVALTQTSSFLLLYWTSPHDQPKDCGRRGGGGGCLWKMPTPPTGDDGGPTPFYWHRRAISAKGRQLYRNHFRFSAGVVGRNGAGMKVTRGAVGKIWKIHSTVTLFGTTYCKTCIILFFFALTNIRDNNPISLTVSERN